MLSVFCAMSVSYRGSHDRENWGGEKTGAAEEGGAPEPRYQGGGGGGRFNRGEGRGYQGGGGAYRGNVGGAPRECGQERTGLLTVVVVFVSRGGWKMMYQVFVRVYTGEECAFGID